METKNESEKVFEQYLDQNGFQGKWTYEPSIPGKSKRPDYLLNWKGNKCFFEVKQLEKKPNDSEVFCDIYKSIRSEIDEARKKFTEYKEYSCSLVLYNCGDSSAVLKPDIILEAMLGNLGIAADFDTEEGETVPGSERNVLTSGGKMIDAKGKRRQNTTISAITVVEEFLDNIEVEKAMRNEVRKHGREFDGPELIAVRMKLHESHDVGNVPRVVVVENPFPRIPFPEDLFKGLFDERWRLIEGQNGRIVRARVFGGNKLKESEGLKGRV